MLNRSKIRKYIQAWNRQGYSDDIPDEVPDVLMNYFLAPSYRAIAIAILKNDNSFQSLGFTPSYSPWYKTLKKMELQERGVIVKEKTLFDTEAA